MNKYKVGELVFKDNELRKIVNVIHTNLGYVYDTKTLDNEIEVCFEDDLSEEKAS